jgi:hypothetical protein
VLTPDVLSTDREHCDKLGASVTTMITMAGHACKGVYSERLVSSFHRLHTLHSDSSNYHSRHDSHEQY